MGNGKQKEELLQLIEDEKLQDSVFIMGKIPNEQVPNVLNSIDIFCATSIFESFGVAVVEAMACQVPVVATNTDGFKEVMEDRTTGILVEKKSVEEIAKALKLLIEDSKLREEYGKNGRKRVLDNYNWNNNVEIMKNIYLRMMEEQKERD